MPKNEYLAESTSGEVTAALASVMSEESPLIVWNRRVGRIKVNGVPLDDQRARFKRPDDVIFYKQTHEALMGADMVAGLGLDDEIENITSADKPDLVLHFRSGLDVYADFTRACVEFDEANDEAIRCVNRRLRQNLAMSPPADWQGRPFTPQITLRRRPTDQIREEALFEEILAFIRAFAGRFGQVGGFGTESPLLSALEATFWWSDSKFESWKTIVSSMFESRDVASLVEIVEQRIANKTALYPQRPLWLFISVSESWASRMGDGAYREFLNGAANGSLTFDLGDFERVAVGVTGRSVWLKSKSSNAA